MPRAGARGGFTKGVNLDASGEVLIQRKICWKTTATILFHLSAKFGSIFLNFNRVTRGIGICKKLGKIWNNFIL